MDFNEAYRSGHAVLVDGTVVDSRAMGFMSDILTRGGTWSLTSKSDPRWDDHGKTETNGFYDTPAEARSSIARNETRFGPKPDDLAFSFMKD